MIPGSCSCPPSALFYHLKCWGSLQLLQEDELLSCLCEGPPCSCSTQTTLAGLRTQRELQYSAAAAAEHGNAEVL